MHDTPTLASRCKFINLKITEVTETIGAILLAAIVVINSIAVFYRFVLLNPVGWTEEALRYSIIWAVYIVGGATIVRGEEMSINLISGIDNKMVRLWTKLLAVFIALMITAVVYLYGIPLLMKNAHQLSPTMRIPMSVPYSAVLVGYSIIAIQTVLHFLSGENAIQREA